MANQTYTPQQASEDIAGILTRLEQETGRAIDEVRLQRVEITAHGDPGQRFAGNVYITFQPLTQFSAWNGGGEVL